MASATALTPRKTEATSEVATVAASHTFMCCMKIGSAKRLCMSGKRNFAITPINPSAMLMGMQSAPAMYADLLAEWASFVAEIACMMNWVVKMAPMLPMKYAKIVD